jgi:phosphate starvation-inducible PhoH-like protein
MQYRIVGQKRGQNYLRGKMQELGLRGKLSSDKFIPVEYLHAAIQDRIDLLRGLMDTDGSVFEHRSGNSRVQYYSTSKKLAEDVRFLVHSLGGTAGMRKREYDESDVHEYRGNAIVHRRPMYVLDIVMGDINPFHISRKADRWKPSQPQRLICNVELLAKKKCQCIRVAAADRLYLTEHCIVTHNTFNDSICIFDEAQNATYTQLKLFLTRFGQNTKVIVTGDPSQSDLYDAEWSEHCALAEVVKKLGGTPGIGMFSFAPEDVVRHRLVSAILRKL